MELCILTHFSDDNQNNFCLISYAHSICFGRKENTCRVFLKRKWHGFMSSLECIICVLSYCLHYSSIYTLDVRFIFLQLPWVVKFKHDFTVEFPRDAPFYPNMAIKWFFANIRIRNVNQTKRSYQDGSENEMKKIFIHFGLKWVVLNILSVWKSHNLMQIDHLCISYSY